ncbi:MAG: hypothetical protein IIB00_08415 [candidate division Zixibacteria bacterium]|nr:hypothetical protein [candidate division Zixibacteria bacterium]
MKNRFGLLKEAYVATQKLALIWVLLMMIAGGCSGKRNVSQYPAQEPRTDWSKIVLDTFEVFALERSEYRSQSYITLEKDTVGEFDENGVMLFRYHHMGLFYHPVLLLNRTTRLLNGFVATGDSGYLRLAIATYDALLDSAIDSSGALWLPYQFDYEVSPGDNVDAPWFSGMSQGLGLDVGLYLFTVTDDSVYLKAADSLFNSLTLLWGESEPWVTRIDSLGYYWIEEYPLPKPSMTLNGSIIGAFGLYEYWKVTRSERALTLFRAALATYDHFAKFYRRPGEYSFYSLTYGKITNVGYHELHKSLYRKLAKMSANPAFGAFADSLDLDG